MRVGPGGWLDVVETAGTVAYDAQGVASGWTVRARLGAGARLTWNGEPFVIADGANVHRVTELDLAPGAVACLRETLVFGRVGEAGGALRSTSRVRLDETELLIEDLDLTEAAVRTAPGLLGACRVVDSVLLLGTAAPPEPVCRPASGTTWPGGHDRPGPRRRHRPVRAGRGLAGLEPVPERKISAARRIIFSVKAPGRHDQRRSWPSRYRAARRAPPRSAMASCNRVRGGVDRGPVRLPAAALALGEPVPGVRCPRSLLQRAQAASSFSSRTGRP